MLEMLLAYNIPGDGGIPGPFQRDACLEIKHDGGGKNNKNRKHPSLRERGEGKNPSLPERDGVVRELHKEEHNAEHNSEHNGVLEVPTAVVSCVTRKKTLQPH